MKHCNKCNELKDESMFAFYRKQRADGTYLHGLKNTCKKCKAKKDGENRKTKRLNDSQYRERKRMLTRERHNRLKIESAKYAECRKSNTRIQNEKKKATGYHKRKAAIKLMQKFESYIGMTCELHLLNCYVCKNAVVLKSNKRVRCKECITNKKFRCYNLIQLNCLVCNNDFESTKKSKGVCYKCQRKKRKRSPNQSGRKKSFDERAKKYNVAYEKINANDIYKRDNYRCLSCGCKVVKSDTYRPDQATIDHVIPMSKGGSHTIDNIVTMCHTCNSIKRDSLITGRQIGLFCKVN